MRIPAPAAARAPGYPEDYERFITLNDGSAVFVRPVVPSDAAMLKDEVGKADPETLYRRFMTPRPRFDDARLAHLTTLDYRWRFAVAAFGLDGEPAGIARYEGVPGDDAAEVAVTVKPEWRRRGLALHLFALLEERAIEQGLRRFNAYYLSDNSAAAALMRATGFTIPHHVAGVAEVEKPLVVKELPVNPPER